MIKLLPDSKGLTKPHLLMLTLLSARLNLANSYIHVHTSVIQHILNTFSYCISSYTFLLFIKFFTVKVSCKKTEFKFSLKISSCGQHIVWN